MSYSEYSPYFVDFSTIDNDEQEMTDAEREVSEKIQKAKSNEEIADVISDALVKSLMDQINL